MSAFKSRLGVSEITDNKSNLGKSLIAELLGNFMLNFFGCISAVTPNTNNVLIAFTFGLTIMALVQVSIKFVLKKLHYIFLFYFFYFNNL